MKKTQWIIYDQCNIRYIQPDITDIVFILFTGTRISSPVGDLTFSLRSRIAEYTIAKGFLAECATLGYATHWIQATTYTQGLCTYIADTGTIDIVYMRPSEEYLARKIEKYILPIPIVQVPNTQFLISPEEFRSTYEHPPVMETFYRYMRKTRNILLEDTGKPVGGKWNYDSENQKWDKKHIPSWQPPVYTDQHIQYVAQAKAYYKTIYPQDTYRDVPIDFPTTRTDALALLDYFLDYHYVEFGRLEDAMYTHDILVHHSYISTALNFGLLHPLEVIQAGLGRHVPLASMEGFVRQILGWREYMRQFYLYYYDTLYTSNALAHIEPLPPTWWQYIPPDTESVPTDITTMNCVDTVLHRVHTHNYAHHIERLMIIGNYTLLRGYHPHSVDRWFWEMYTDAFEWVVSPNVLGMSQYADGGKLATKPYISGGAYIDRMSDYCSGCRYSIKEKTCPMTDMYWDFVDRNQDIFRKGRTPYVLSTLAKVDIEKIRTMKEKFVQRTRM